MHTEDDMTMRPTDLLQGRQLRQVDIVRGLVGKNLLKCQRTCSSKFLKTPLSSGKMYESDKPHAALAGRS